MEKQSIVGANDKSGCTRIYRCRRKAKEHAGSPQNSRSGYVFHRMWIPEKENPKVARRRSLQCVFVQSLCVLQCNEQAPQPFSPRRRRATPLSICIHASRRTGLSTEA